jgi:hypothetical protein
VRATIPEIERELVAAARRLAAEHGAAEPPSANERPARGRRGGRRRGTGALALAVGLTLAAGSAAAVLVERGVVGGEPTHRYGPDAPEADIGIHYRTRPVVIAAGRLPDGEPFELVGYQQGSRADQYLCIDIHFPRRRYGSGCGSNTGYTQSITRGPGHPTTVTGAATPETAKVLVHYRRGERRASSTAALELIADPEVLARIQVTDPFGFYVAELPEGARDMSAEGLDARGRRLWEGDFLEPDYSRTKRIKDPYLRLKR